jgi:hypothetical protein
VKINARFLFMNFAGLMIYDGTDEDFLVIEADEDDTGEDLLVISNYIKRQNLIESPSIKFAVTAGPDVLVATSWISMITGFLSNASMYKLMAAIGELSQLLHHLLIPIVLAAFLDRFINKLMKLVALDPLPIDDYLDQWFGG